MPIRQRLPDVESFVVEFQESLRPSAISMDDFINWERIEARIDQYGEQFEWLEKQSGKAESEFVSAVANKLLSTTHTRRWLTFFFALLGHSQNKTDYAALEGLWKFRAVTKSIEEAEKSTATEIAEVLHEIGLQHVVNQTSDLESHFRGYLVGMESHKRKNRQGTSFEGAVEKELLHIVDQLHGNGYEVELIEEYQTAYQDESGQSKTVDFAILKDGRPRIVFEANSYTGGGSKPSEVKRAYDRVSTRMRNDGIECVWITDGEGWRSSLGHLLREAYVDFVDLYNFDMVQNELGDDVINFFENGPVAHEDDVVIPKR